MLWLHMSPQNIHLSVISVRRFLIPNVFFPKQEERVHARKFAEYIQKRGGVASYTPISSPKITVKSALDSLHRALEMENEILSKLSAIAELAEEHNDKQLGDFIVEMIEEQYKSISKLGHMITQLQRAGPEGLGLHLFDKDLQ
jgi:ferritin